MRIFKNLGYPVGEPSQPEEEQTFTVFLNRFEMSCIENQLRKDPVEEGTSIIIADMLRTGLEYDHEKEIIGNVSQMLKDLRKRKRQKEGKIQKNETNRKKVRSHKDTGV